MNSSPAIIECGMNSKSAAAALLISLALSVPAGSAHALEVVLPKVSPALPTTSVSHPLLAAAFQNQPLNLEANGYVETE